MALGLKVTRDGNSNRGKRPRVACFDCGESTGAPVQVFRRSDRKQIDWQKDGRDGAFITFVHRAGTGCNKDRTDGEVRHGAK